MKPFVSLTLIIPIPVGTKFDAAIQILIRYADWDRAIMSMLYFHEEKHPEVMLFKSEAVKRRVHEDGMDDESEGDVIHAIVDSDAGIITLNTSIEIPTKDIVYS